MAKERNITIENHKFKWIVGKNHVVWIKPNKDDSSNPLKTPVKCNIGFDENDNKISINPSMVSKWVTENIFNKEWDGKLKDKVYIGKSTLDKELED